MAAAEGGVMRVLVTGSEGHIGRVQVDTLREAGHEVRTFDREAPRETPAGDHFTGDLRDRDLVQKALQGMDAVAHLGAIPGDWEGHDAEIMEINVQGTWNILDGCIRQGIHRAVCFSSIQALGNVCGFRESEYLPIDDAYPRHPMSAYQLSKHLGEEACRSFSNRYGMTTICLRPVAVFHPDQYQRWRQSAPDPERPARVSNYWAYVDVRDVCRATLRGLEAKVSGHDAFLLAADDTISSLTTAELVDRYYPDTPWRSVDRGSYLAANPHRTLVDCSHAAAILGWRPQHIWRESPLQSPTQSPAQGT